MHHSTPSPSSIFLSLLDWVTTSLCSSSNLGWQSSRHLNKLSIISSLGTKSFTHGFLSSSTMVMFVSPDASSTAREMQQKVNEDADSGNNEHCLSSCCFWLDTATSFQSRIHLHGWYLQVEQQKLHEEYTKNTDLECQECLWPS